MTDAATALPAPDLAAAAKVIDLADGVVGAAAKHLAATGGPDVQQVLAYDLAHAAAQVATARALLDYGAKGEIEGRLACAFTAEMVHDLITRLCGREELWGLEPAPLRAAHPFLATFRTPEVVASFADEPGPRHLDADFEMVQDTFRAFADKVIKPRAEHVHRFNEDVPEEVISGLAEMGAFGLSVPADYDGFNEGGDGEYMGMVVATEELSRGSLGIGGSLITRPEILTRALVKGGTEAQKLHWLPKLASAEVMAAVAVTEPDYGSDVAGLKVTATEAAGPNGEPGFVINGVKTWCTFAARADVLDAAGPQRAAGEGPPRAEPVHRPQAARRGPRLRLRPGADRRRLCRQDGGSGDRHHRLPGHAQLRGGPGQLVGAGDEPDRRGRGPRQGLLLPDGGLRERPAADRGAGARGHAGGLRGGRRVRPEPGRVRPRGLRLRADPG